MKTNIHSYEVFHELLRSLGQVEKLFDDLAYNVTDAGSKDNRDNLVTVARRIRSMEERGPFRKAQQIEQGESGYRVKELA